MWLFGVLVPSFVLVGSACIAVLCNERRPLVVLCLGGMVGLIVTGIALSWLALLFGIAAATWITLVLLLSGGLAAAVYWWRSGLLQAEQTVSWKYVALLLVLAAHMGLVAAVFWQFLVGVDGHQDVLLAHSAYAASIARGNFPVMNPYQPDQLLTYRLTYHVIGAFVTRLMGQTAPEALTGLTGALIAFLFLGAVGLGLAARLGPRRTLLAAALFMTVSNLRWLELRHLVSLENPVYNHHALVSAFLVNPVRWALATSVGNPSLSYGYLALLCALTLYLYFWRSDGWRRLLLALATGVVLGHLSAASESWFAALFAALLVDLAVRFLYSRKLTRGDMLRASVAALAWVVTATTSPGILFARLFGRAEGSLGLQFKGLRLFYLPPGAYGKEDWAPVIETDFAWTLLALLLMLPFVLFYIWRAGDRLSWLLLLYSGACFSAFLLFNIEVSYDMWRFVQAGIASFGFVAALAAFWYISRLRSSAPLVRHAASVALACATLVCVGGYVAHSLSLPWLADPRPQVRYRLDVEAVKAFLHGETDVKERLLVLGGDVRWCFAPSCMRDLDRRLLSAYVVAHSGQFYPTGSLFAGRRLGYAFDSPNMRHAAAGQGKLSTFDIQALDITYLYASEPWLNSLQRAALAEKLTRGSLERVWQAVDAGPPRTCRAFVRVDKPPSVPVAAVAFDEGEKIALPQSPLRLEVPSLQRAIKSSGRSRGPDDQVQATVLIASSEPTEVRVDNGAGFSLRRHVEQAVAIRTPPLDPGTILTIRTELGTASVQWIEVYAPVAPDSSVFLPEDLELCS